MMILDEQRNSIKTWLTDGDSLADVQRKLKSEYGLTMTYMDVRLLVLEIGAEVQEEPEPEPEPEPAPSPNAEKVAAADAELEEAADAEPRVSLSIDRLIVPGAMVSGDVVFTDGTKAKWLIDNQGRFGIEPEVEGYQPTEMDLRLFQTQLRDELHRKGYA
ncbi:MAG: hypothetical protein WC340_08430 [Kiritimatiellia bacterium]